MLSRRSFLVGPVIAAALAGARSGWGQAILTDDGLYRQPWFLDSLLELADDLDDASGKGKRFAIMWELRGCPYCKDTHLVNFAKPEIADFVKETVRHPAAQHHRCPRGHRFRRREAGREAAGGEVWRPLHAHVSILPARVPQVSERASRANARSRVRRDIWCRTSSSRCSGSYPSAPMRRAASATTSKRTVSRPGGERSAGQPTLR